MTRVLLAALGSVAAAAPLNAPSPGPVRRFRRVVRVSLATGGAAHRIEVLADTAMTVVFSSRDYDALASGAPDVATLSSVSGDLVLRLPVAREVASVRLGSALTGDQVAAYRFDGLVVSEDAVAVGTHSSSGALLNVTDAQLILRRRRAATDLPLSVAEVAGVMIGVDPALPRIAFAIVGDPEGEVALPPDTDATGAPVLADTASWGPRLAAALTAQLARFAAGLSTLPDSLALDLILESDTPCQAAITAFDLGYELLRTGFADNTAKQVLRFAPGSGATQSVSISVPSPMTALSAPLRLTLAGAGASSALRKAGIVTDGGLLTEALPESVSQGVAVVPGGLAATRITLDAAVVVTGAQVVFGAVETPAEVTLSFWDDAGGLPGQRLAESVAAAVTAGRPTAVTLTFMPAVTLAAGAVWMAVSTRRGRVVLGLAAATGGLVATGDGIAWTVLKAADGMTVASRLLTPRTVGEGTSSGASDLTVTAAGVALSLVAEGALWVADLAGVLNALPASHPEAIEVEISAASGGVMTLDPPTLRYVII